MDKQRINNQYMTGERALFQGNNLLIENCVFDDGESPLKEAKDLEIIHSSFQWKYPLWYATNIDVHDTTFLETARSGIWYTQHITIEDSLVAAPKTLRRASDITLKNIDMPHAQETLWQCDHITMDHVNATGDYFGMNSKNIQIHHLHLTGNYCFDGASHIEVHDSLLLSKDAFWNSENVTIYDSTIIGEYLAWNAKNITFVNCTIESLQGLCYIENLKMINCKFMNTTLAFEYSSVDATIASSIQSIMNPLSGRIKARSIEEIIMDPEKIDPSKIDIIVEETQPLLSSPLYTKENCYES